MILYAGEPRYLLYGTDWPICRMRTYLKFVDELGLSPETREKLLWKNAAKLFRLDIPEAAESLGDTPVLKCRGGKNGKIHAPTPIRWCFGAQISQSALRRQFPDASQRRVFKIFSLPKQRLRCLIISRCSPSLHSGNPTPHFL